MMRAARRATAGLAPLVLLLPLAGCESTQDKSERLRKQAGPLKQEKGLKITERSKDVRITGTDVVFDPEVGAAAVVELRNTSRKVLAGVPVAIDVLDGKGASLFRNDTPGIEPALVSASVLEPGQTLVWVNDQIQAATAPEKVEAIVGVPRAAAPPKVPELKVSEPKLIEDPVSGLASTGYVKNASSIEQRQVIIFGVARKGGRVVAAGRSGIKRIKPGRRGRYKIFWIGDPKGASYVLAAPATRFQPAGVPK